MFWRFLSIFQRSFYDIKDITIGIIEIGDIDRIVGIRDRCILYFQSTFYLMRDNGCRFFVNVFIYAIGTRRVCVRLPNRKYVEIFRWFHTCTKDAIRIN